MFKEFCILNYLNILPIKYSTKFISILLKYRPRLIVLLSLLTFLYHFKNVILFFGLQYKKGFIWTFLF